VEAHYKLSLMYNLGYSVEKDRGKEIYLSRRGCYWRSSLSRYDLGYDAKEYDISERAVRHWIISAILGDDGSIKALMAA